MNSTENKQIARSFHNTAYEKNAFKMKRTGSNCIRIRKASHKNFRSMNSTENNRIARSFHNTAHEKNAFKMKRTGSNCIPIGKASHKNFRWQNSGSSNEVIKIMPSTAHREKQKAICQLQSLHKLLQAKPPDAKEIAYESIVLGGKTIDQDEEEEEIMPATKKWDWKKPKPRKEAWCDQDDEAILVGEKAKTINNCHRSITARSEEKYSGFVQEKFMKIVGEPYWAELDRKTTGSSDESDDELLHKAGNCVRYSKSLAMDRLNIRKCSGFTHKSLSASNIKSIEFHSTSRVALVASSIGTVNLFQVDGKINSHIQSIIFESFPIETAHFSSNGNEIIAISSKFGYFYTYDMIVGKTHRIPWQKGMELKRNRQFQMSPDGRYMVIHGRYGNIHLISTKTKEWMGSLKMNGEVNAVTFTSDGSKMYSHGELGEVYIWDMNSRTCIHKFADEGCITGTSIAVSPNHQFLATGSDSGIANIYDNFSVTASHVPIKVIKNLTTEINSLKFNATSEILSLSSSEKDGALKLAHFPSMTVFSNFPYQEDCKLLKKVQCLDISPSSGFMMVGNNRSVLLYRLKQFRNY